jgi:hypothetical protein
MISKFQNMFPLSFSYEKKEAKHNFLKPVFTLQILANNIHEYYYYNFAHWSLTKRCDV